MQKERALALKEFATNVAVMYSNNDRAFNYNNESFSLESLKPLSESTALAYFRKSSGKIGIAFCFWTNGSGGRWNYFFPTYDHCVGMEQVRDKLGEVEGENFPLNFED